MNTRRRKMANIIKFRREGRRRILFLCSLLVIQVALIKVSNVNASFYNMNDDGPGYDPELNYEGNIPEPAHRRLTPAAAAVKWNYDDHHDEDTHDVLPARSVQPRSDSDVDEDEEEDRDEDKSGTSAHGSYTESPSYGESPRAAQDGEDIENFFDTHLGPHEAHENTQADGDSAPGSSAAESQQVDDPDEDHYETAASSPLSDIFHTIIRAHRRPLIITTSDDSSPPATQSSTSSASSIPNPSESSQSASSLVGSTSSPIAGIPFVRGSPFLDVPQATTGAYFTPIAASASSYEPQGVQGDSSSQDGHEEIYIARRPSFLPLARIRNYAIPLNRDKLNQQSSNSNWRVHPTASRPTYEQQSSSGDQARYPFASSYVYQSAPRLQQVPAQIYQQQQQSSTSAPEEEQTVSYGLSFGGSPSLPIAVGSYDGGSSSESSSNIGEKSIDEPLASHYSSNNPAAYPYKPYVRPNLSASQSYNNYNYPPPLMGQLAATPAAPYPLHQGLQSMGQQSAYHQVGSAFKDAQGQAQQALNYNQYSGSNSLATKAKEEPRWSKTRQQLLANLDQQIKINPYYRQKAASAPETQYVLQSRYQINRKEVPRHPVSASLPEQQVEPIDPDVDTYRSYHSEKDPFKSFTSSSELVNEPQPDNSEQKNDHRPPATIANDETVTSETRSNNSYSSHNYGNKQQQKSILPSTSLITSYISSPSSKATKTTSTPTFSKDRSLNPLRYDSQRVNNQSATSDESIHTQDRVKYRVRREDSDDRENDDAEDDGVWVDDDEDDDNRQSATDVTETTEEPAEEERSENENNQSRLNVPEHNHITYTPGILGNPHGYELSPY